MADYRSECMEIAIEVNNLQRLIKNISLSRIEEEEESKTVDMGEKAVHRPSEQENGGQPCPNTQTKNRLT